MKFLPLIFAGLWRRPARAVLTGVCIAIAFVLLGLLEGVNAGFRQAIALAHRDLLRTDTRVRGADPMPISSMAKIQAVPGVVEVAPRAYLQGTFGEPTPDNTIAAIATEPDTFFHLRPQFAVSRESLTAVRQNRPGMLATPALIRHFGWKLGDTITLRSSLHKTDGTSDWTFVLVGDFDARTNPGTAEFGIINYSY